MAEYDPSIKYVLPHERIYTLQIGSETFKVSGASLSSDSPSYFTDFFLRDQNKDKVLIIDRSNEIFRLILQHLQGYHLEIGNADIYTRLFNDALYYNLPQLLKTLTISNDYYFTIVESEYFKIPKRLLNNPDTGNFPNFFSVSNDALYKDISVLMLNKDWIRPPPQAAPSLARSISLLRDLVSMLENIDIEIRSKEHRCSLIKEAKYYRFNGLVQKLIEHKIVFNSLTNKEEIIISLNHVEHKNITLAQNVQHLELGYQRPYGIDSQPRPLFFQIDSNNEIILDFFHNKLTIKNQTLKKLTKVFRRLMSKMAPTVDFNPLNQLQLNLIENKEVCLLFNDEKININEFKQDTPTNKKRRLGESETEEEHTTQKEWVLKTGIFQFLFNMETNSLEAMLLKGKIFPNDPASFYSDLEFV